LEGRQEHTTRSLGITLSKCSELALAVSRYYARYQTQERRPQRPSALNTVTPEASVLRPPLGVARPRVLRNRRVEFYRMTVFRDRLEGFRCHSDRAD
jgi:hypothetical protein